jgi:hypothetical protein
VDLRALLSPGMCIKIHDARADEPTVYRISAVGRGCVIVADSLPMRRMRPLQQHSGTSYSGAELPSANLLTLPAATSRLTDSDVGNWVYVGDSAVGQMAQILSVLSPGASGYYTQATITPSPDVDTEGLSVSVWDGTLTWSAGTNAPNYDNVLPPANTGYISDVIDIPGSVILSGADVQYIVRVGSDNAQIGTLDDLTGQYVCTTQVPAASLPDASLGQYSARRMWPLYAGTDVDAVVVMVAALEPTERGPATVVDTDTDVLELTDTAYTFTSADVGRYILLVAPESQGNAASFEVTALVSDNVVELTRSSASSRNQDVASQQGVYWKWDPATAVNGSDLSVEYVASAVALPSRQLVEAPLTRAVAASTKVRPVHTARVILRLSYTLRPDAASRPSHTSIARQLSEFVAAFPVTDVLHLDDLATVARQAAPQIGKINRDSGQSQMTWSVMSPTGDLIDFGASDSVQLKSSLCRTADDALRLRAAIELGLSERLLRPSLSAADVQLVEV